MRSAPSPNARRVGRPTLGPDLAPLDDRQTETAAHPLEQRLVHAEGGGRDPGPRVGQIRRLEQRLDGAVLAPRAVQGDRDDRCRPLGRRDGPGPRRTSAGPRRPAIRGGRTRRPVDRRGDGRTGSHHQAPVQVDQDLAGPRSPRRRGASAMAVPETIETSCSAEGPPRRTQGGRGRRLAVMSHPPSPTSRQGTGFRARGRATSRARISSWTRSTRRRTSVARPLLIVHDEVRVLLGHDGTADPQALQSSGVDEPSGRVPRRIAEDAAGRWQAEWLMRLAPVADLIETES